MKNFILLLGSEGSEDNKEKLKAISFEIGQIEKLLDPISDVKVDRQTNLDNLKHYLNLGKDRILILHFAGHTNTESLEATDSIIDSDILAEHIDQWSVKPKIIFLNGCNNSSQVEKFHKAGIPIIIATHSDIFDKSASEFAIKFYVDLFDTETNSTVVNAFKSALTLVTMGKLKKKAILRSSRSSNLEDFNSKEVNSWALFTSKDEYEEWTQKDIFSEQNESRQGFIYRLIGKLATNIQIIFKSLFSNKRLRKFIKLYFLLSFLVGIIFAIYTILDFGNTRKIVIPTEITTDAKAETNKISLIGKCEKKFGEIMLTGINSIETKSNLIHLPCNSDGEFTYSFTQSNTISKVKGNQIYGNQSSLWFKEKKFGASKRGKTIVIDNIPYSVNGILTAARNFTLTANCDHSGELYKVSFEDRTPIDVDCDKGKLETQMTTYGGTSKRIIITSPGGAKKHGYWWSGMIPVNGKIKFTEIPPPTGLIQPLSPLKEEQLFFDEKTGLSWVRDIYLLGVTGSFNFKEIYKDDFYEKDIWETINKQLNSICTIKPCLRLAKLDEVHTMITNLGEKKLEEEFTSLRSYTGAFNILGVVKIGEEHKVFGIQTSVDSETFQLKVKTPTLINIQYKINDVGLWLVRGN